MARRYGILGSNIGYTRSPLIHETAARVLGLSGVTYEVFDRSADLSITEVLEDLAAQGVIGLNVTTPFKGAVGFHNTLTYKNGVWERCSTDGIGLVRALERLPIPWQSMRHLVILGNGGVVPSLLTSLQAAWQPTSVVIACRKPLPECIPLDRVAHAVTVLGKEPILLINALPLNKACEVVTEIVANIKLFTGIAVDLNYAETSPLKEFASRTGCIFQDGMPMLIEQALESERVWGWHHETKRQQSV